MRHGILAINGVPAQYTEQSIKPEPLYEGANLNALQATEHVAGIEHIVQYLPDVNAKRDFGPLVVPAEQYFMLGDNRDNSEDSRYIGSVSRELLIGKANHLLVSADIKANWLPRFARFGQALQ
jgi:signal peptidase I